jgi:hypothetical protein
MPDRITEQQLADWQRLADAATPGPWFVDFAGEIGEKFAIICDVARGSWGSDALNFGEDHATAQFVAAARVAVPALIAALRDARAAGREQ